MCIKRQDRFLSHIERCPVLLHLVDAVSGDVAGDYAVVGRELAAYGQGLAQKPRLVALSKIDAAGDGLEETAAALEEAADRPVHRLSAVTGEGLRGTLRALAGIIADRRALGPVEASWAS